MPTRAQAIAPFVLILALLAPSGPAWAGRPRPATIYLNGLGGPMRGGRDVPTENRASALGDQRVAVPPFAGSAEQWKEIVECVRQGFAPFAVDLTTERPARPGYSMIVVGGSPSLLGREHLGRQHLDREHLGGYAPVGDGRERELVGFVFPEVAQNDPAKVCQAILHESGHLLGLDHVYACEDPMSYLSCGTQRFLESEQPCGESEPRPCRYRGGAARKRQSSAQLLAQHVGWRDGVAPRPSAEPPAYLSLPILASLAAVVPRDKSDKSQKSASDDRGATIAPAAPEQGSPDVVAAADAAQQAAQQAAAQQAAAKASSGLDVRGLEVQRGGDFIELVVVARSERHVYDVALQWNSALRQVTFTCDDLAAGKDPDASCRRQGNVFSFRIRAGTGQREVRALALDARDLWLLSGTAAITLTQ
jgi:hypothetical protein